MRAESPPEKLEREIHRIVSAEIKVHQAPARQEHKIDRGGAQVEFFGAGLVALRFGLDSQIDPVFRFERTETSGEFTIAIGIPAVFLEMFREQLMIVGVRRFEPDRRRQRFGRVGAVGRVRGG